MRIGFINSCGHYPPDIGSSAHAFQTVAGFIRHGHTVNAFRGNYPYASFRKYSYASLAGFIRNTDVLYIRLLNGISQDAHTLLRSLRPFSLPVVWEMNAPSYETRDVKAWFVGCAWKLLAKLADASVCVSEELRDYAEDVLGVASVFVVPNGSDPGLFSPGRRDRQAFGGLGDDEFLVLWAGSSQYPWHGTDIILKVAEKITRINKKIKFLLIADPAFIGSQHIAENMIIKPCVPYFSMPGYIASSDACLCLYHSFAWSKIGFYMSPMKLFDYMSCARPVIATDAGQISRGIRSQENGLLTDNSPDDIIDKIMFLYENKARAREMGDAARKDIVDFYNWDRGVVQTIRVLEAAIHRDLKTLRSQPRLRGDRQEGAA
ncbi:MAG: glycosyltransferase [Candidatus Omnitrophica bacterium]|nr:glycosyltransferase [Candidatus Omnitrophota bacterium]